MGEREGERERVGWGVGERERGRARDEIQRETQKDRGWKKEDAFTMQWEQQ